MMWSALKDAKVSKSSMAILWLELANAYGSVPHKLIVFALRRYKVPEDWISLIMAYYDGMWGRTTLRLESHQSGICMREESLRDAPSRWCCLLRLSMSSWSMLMML